MWVTVVRKKCNKDTLSEKKEFAFFALSTTVVKVSLYILCSADASIIQRGDLPFS